MRPHFLFGAVAVGLSMSSLALAEPKDAQAEKALGEIEDDYLETRFEAAEQKLREAIDACGESECSPAIKAKLYASLGSLLAAGKKQLEDAKAAFVEALQIDKSVGPNPDMLSGEVTFAFDQAKKQLGIGAPIKPPEKPTPKPPSECGEGEPCPGGLTCDAGKCVERAAPPTEVSTAKKNWVSVTFEPDVSVISGNNVCAADAQANLHWVCVRDDKSRYVGTPTVDNADNVNTGLALSTLRVVVGYDRLALDNVMLGLRVGFAFNGATDGGASFIPVHVEGRATFYPGRRPLEGSGVRPFFFFGGGLAQVDAKVDVEVLEDGATCGAASARDIASPCTKPSRDGVIEPRRQTLKAYRQAGPGFAALGVGLELAPVAGAAFHLGVRGSATFPTIAAVITPEAGFMLGF